VDNIIVILLVFLMAVPAGQAQTVTFMGFDRNGEVCRRGGGETTVDGWSAAFDPVLTDRTKLTVGDLTAPRNLTYRVEAQWPDLQRELAYLVGEQARLFDGSAFAAGQALYGVPMDGANRADAGWEPLEFEVAQRTADVIDRYRALRAAYEAAPTTDDGPLTAFLTELRRTAERLCLATQQALAATKGHGGLANEDAFQSFFDEYVSPSGTGWIDPEQIVQDPSQSELIGRSVTLTQDIPQISITMNRYANVVSTWKQERNPKVSDLRERTKSYLYSNPYKRDQLATGRPSGPRRNTTMFVNGVIKNKQGTIIAVVVGMTKGSPNGFVIPYHGSTDGPVRRYFQRPLAHPVEERLLTDPMAQKPLGPWARELFAALKTLEDQTSRHDILGVASKATMADRVTYCTEQRARAILDGAQALYDLFRTHRAPLLGSDHGLLRDLYESLANVEASLNSVLEHYGPKADLRKAPTALWLGSAQNLVAICVAIIGEAYKFDAETTVATEDGSLVVRRKSRLGNFYSYGTASEAAVTGANYLMSGHYGLHRFIYEGKAPQVTIAVRYDGLEYDKPVTNPYRIVILDPYHPQYEQLLSELSVSAPTTAGGVHRRSIAQCPAFRNAPGGPVLADRPLPSKQVDPRNQGTVEFSFPAPQNAERSYVVYQEAAGLTYAPWVADDEVTTEILAYDSRPDEQVEPDGFRVIIDASGTMRGLFPKVVAGLRKNLEQLDAAYLASEISSFRPVHLFSSENSEHTIKSPYTLAELDRAPVGGASFIKEAVRTLGTNIPDKPWILLVLSDFNNNGSPYFNAEDWATTTRLTTPERPGKPSRPLPPLLKRDPRGTGYVINASGDPNQGWPGLMQIYCIAVQPLLTKLPPIRTAENDWMWRSSRFSSGGSAWVACEATWLAPHRSGLNGVTLDLMDFYRPNPNVLDLPNPEPAFQQSLQKALGAMYRTHQRNEQRGGTR